MRMLASALRRDVRNRAFEDLQQRLLDAFARHIASDGGVLVLAANLVDFIDVDDAGLGARHIAVGGLQQLQNDIFDIFADVSGFGQRGRVHDGKRHIEHARQGLRHQRFAAAGGADQQDVRFGQLHIAGAGAVHLDALVVVVDGHRQLLLGGFLADDIFVQKGSYFMRLGQMRRRGRRPRLGLVVFQNGVADGDAFIADVGPRIIARGGNELGHGILRFVAERTTEYVIGTSAGLHLGLLLPLQRPSTPAHFRSMSAADQ